MILCIDCGNTRIKWGWRDKEDWAAQGVLNHAEIGELGERLGCQSGLPERIMVANVAGPTVEQMLRAALPNGWAERLCLVRSVARGGGVVNGYAEPERLGVDRWCALIGARQTTRSACVVVGSGTATTVDTLDDAGNFLGGLILPGFDLMRGALARNTAGLPLAQGRYEPFPRCTDDAIFSGCLEAQVGAIERSFARAGGAPTAECLLFGGNAPLLAEHLSIPWRRIDTLVLNGLYRLARKQPQED